MGDEAGEKRVHGPGERFLTCRAKFHSGHVDDVGRAGKTRERGRVEEIASDRLDVPRFEFLRKGGGRKAGYGEDAAGDSGCVGSAASHARERWAHFAAGAENEDVARERGERADGGFRRLAEEEFELVYAYDRIFTM